jgi:pyridinium-3,5-biscarboxylic acid mononucleotide synthase
MPRRPADRGSALTKYVTDRVAHLLQEVGSGRLSVDDAVEQLTQGGTPLPFAVLDDDRQRRTGFDEVVYGSGKTAEQLISIASDRAKRGTALLMTRVDADMSAKVIAAVPLVTYEPDARIAWLRGTEEPFTRRFEGVVWVISGGTSDLPVVCEAARTAEWLGLNVQVAADIGVAGLPRLLARLPELQQARVIIAVAGMEGALPSVVAGLVRAPVIGVPTSIGYGTHLNGLTPLFAMLTACADGLTVVNIDNGFGAAMAAARMVAS